MDVLRVKPDARDPLPVKEKFIQAKVITHQGLELVIEAPGCLNCCSNLWLAISMWKSDLYRR